MFRSLLLLQPHSAPSLSFWDCSGLCGGHVLLSLGLFRPMWRSCHLLLCCPLFGFAAPPHCHIGLNSPSIGGFPGFQGSFKFAWNSHARNWRKTELITWNSHVRSLLAGLRASLHGIPMWGTRSQGRFTWPFPCKYVSSVPFAWQIPCKPALASFNEASGELILKVI